MTDRPRRRSSDERSAAVFAALRSLLLAQPWGEVTLEAVARDAGVSRQTLYNAFGSRYGLAQAYALALAEALCDLIAATVTEYDDPQAGLEAGLALYLETCVQDPLIQRVRAGDAHHDLVRVVTTDAGPLLLRVAERFEAVIVAAWPHVTPERARAVARTLARLAAGYVTMPPERDQTPGELAAELACAVAPALASGTS